MAWYVPLLMFSVVALAVLIFFIAVEKQWLIMGANIAIFLAIISLGAWLDDTDQATQLNKYHIDNLQTMKK
jgi:hypothetical protein